MGNKGFITFFCLAVILFTGACSNEAPHENRTATTDTIDSSAFSLLILGTIQDGGSPHIGCSKACCKDLFLNPDLARQIVSLGLIDKEAKKTYLFEATPDINRQLKTLKKASGFIENEYPEAIFLTHAHIGHYTGLMYLGKEASNSKAIKVYAMPRFQVFLRYNGPWSQLVNNGNISLRGMQNGLAVVLRDSIKVIPILVPHRDEYSETVGYIIHGPHKKVLFIPDIDKWEKWNKEIVELVKEVDYAFLDATFFDGEEIKQRDLSQIPHPFVVETMAKFSRETAAVKNKIYFIHLNHTNPLLDIKSKAYQSVRDSGYHVAAYGSRFTL